MVVVGTKMDLVRVARPHTHHTLDNPGIYPDTSDWRAGGLEPADAGTRGQMGPALLRNVGEARLARE